MTQSLALLVVTDLDGTLIDHQTYQWTPAGQALDALRGPDRALVLASSKTAAEIGALRADIGFDHWPAIVENGAGLLPPGAADLADKSAYHALRSALDTLPQELRAAFTGFGDLTAQGVAEATGLSPKAAALAKARGFSEPGRWSGSEADRAHFLEHLQAQGIQAQQGGRFLTLSFGGNKADRVAELRAAHSPATTIALGDAPNDVAMLEAADIGVIIANPHGQPLPPLKGEAEGRIIRTDEAGPRGWNDAILTLLDRLDLQRI